MLAIFAIPLPVNGILFRNRNEIENSKIDSLSMDIFTELDMG